MNEMFRITTIPIGADHTIGYDKEASVVIRDQDSAKIQVKMHFDDDERRFFMRSLMQSRLRHTE